MNGHFSRLAGAILLSFSSFTLAAPQLLTPVRPLPEAVRAKSGIEGSPVRFNSDVVSGLAPGEEVELTLPDGSTHTYLSEDSIDQGGGITTWIARSPLAGDNQRAIITYGPHGAWGWMRTEYGRFRIYPSGLGYDLVAPQPYQDNSPKFPGGDAIVPAPDMPDIEPLKGVTTHVMPQMKATNPFAKTTPTPSVQADVMVIYTQDLANKLGNSLMPMIYNLFVSANQAYVDSEIAFSLRLVNATLINYSNSNGSSDTLHSMANGGSQNLAFQSLTWDPGSVRNAVGADFAAFIRDGPNDTGGIAFLLPNPAIYPSVNPVATNAYSVSNYCAQGCDEIFAHELGHNMGNAHDIATVAKDANATGSYVTTGSGVFSYSFGYYSCSGALTCNPFTPGGCPTAGVYAYCGGSDANDFGTIMSYQNVKIMKFSNPNLSNCHGPSGAGPNRACGGPEPSPAPAITANNALSMNNVRGSVGAYRTQVIANRPGSLQFTATSYAGTEAGGTITFTVSRAQVDPGAGAVSVNYAVTAATATAGLDFTAASGTLNWAAGDTTNKTFNVTILNDQAQENTETFVATLSSPAGSTGVYLGYPSTATGVILDTFPIGTIGGLPTAPAGWSTPAGSVSPWAISNDSAPSGDPDGTSLKSGAITPTVKNCDSNGNSPGSTNSCPSILQFSGNFSAGTVSFAYRVNGMPFGYGSFEFYIDGTLTLSPVTPPATADTGWLSFSTPITAGAHTLQWRYRSTYTLGLCNSGVFFPAQNGNPQYGPWPTCQDRAWIDQVSFPIVLLTPGVTIGSNVNPSSAGQSVTFSTTVAGSGGTPTGSVTYRANGVDIVGCVNLPLTSGQVQCSTSVLPAGGNSIVAIYSGNTAYASNTSATITQTVSSGPQLMSANPSTLNFGGQSMNTTSPAQSSTITNTTSGPITVTGVTASAGYNVTHNCGPLAAAATCTVNVTFTPVVAGSTASAPGTVSITYAGGGPTLVNLTGTAERSLVTHYYRAILRRAPDAGGKVYWDSETVRMQSRSVNVNEVWFSMAQFFYFSPEYASFNRDDTGFVTDLYTTFFNRAPDSGGLQYWVGQIGSGMPREVVLAGFMFSPEFVSFTQAIFGNTAARAEVDMVGDFYRGLLGRLGDDGGLTTWFTLFRTAQCAGSSQVYAQVEAISSAFATGAEYTGKNRTNAQYVGDLYNAFLRRGGDLAGVQFWINFVANPPALAQGEQPGTGRERARRDFIASAEFQGRVSSVIAQGCYTGP